MRFGSCCEPASNFESALERFLGARAQYGQLGAASVSSGVRIDPSSGRQRWNGACKVEDAKPVKRQEANGLMVVIAKIIRGNPPV